VDESTSTPTGALELFTLATPMKFAVTDVNPDRVGLERALSLAISTDPIHAHAGGIWAMVFIIQ
jgi:hypothetical protein